MKEFLMLIRENTDNGNASPQEIEEEIKLHFAWIEEISEKGHFKAGDPLESDGKVISGREKFVTNGPYVESKECISGYYFLLANSLDEATEIAKGCPSLQFGGKLEIREIMDTNAHG